MTCAKYKIDLKYAKVLINDESAPLKTDLELQVYPGDIITGYEVQDFIDLIPKNINGHTVTIQFNEAQYQNAAQIKSLNFTGFYGGGTINLFGDPVDMIGQDENENKLATLFNKRDAVNSQASFINCAVQVRIEQLGFKAEFNDNTCLFFKNCSNDVFIERSSFLGLIQNYSNSKLIIARYCISVESRRCNFGQAWTSMTSIRSRVVITFSEEYGIYKTQFRTEALGGVIHGRDVDHLSQSGNRTDTGGQVWID